MRDLTGAPTFEYDIKTFGMEDLLLEAHKLNYIAVAHILKHNEDHQ